MWVRRPKGASGVHKVSASRAAHASDARLYIYIYAVSGQKYLDTSLFHVHLILKWAYS